MLILTSLLRKPRPRENFYVALVLVIISYLAVKKMLFLTGWIITFPHLVNTSIPSLFLLGPLIYFYTLSLIEGRKISPRDWIVHSMLAIAAAIYLFGFYRLPSNEKLSLISSSEFKNFRMVAASLIILQNSVYAGISFRTMTSAAQKACHVSSQFLSPVFLWLRVLVGGFACLNVAALGGLVFRISKGSEDYVLTFALFTFTAALNFFALRLSPIFNVLRKEEQQLEIEASKPDRPPVSGLDKLSEKILYQLKDQRLYMQPSLKLSDLAESVQAPGYLVSQALNRQLDTTFYDLINSLRIEAATRMLRDDHFAHYSILGVATEVGFASKSVFNSLFKKTLGVTPSEYRSASLSTGSPDSASVPKGNNRAGIRTGS
jgi:AraC-like DNA-binding protein